MQLSLDTKFAFYTPPKSQLLKWVGNKQKFAAQITRCFPVNFNNFYEPFLGSGAIIATVNPKKGIGSDVFKPLIEIWNKLKEDPKGLVQWYADRRNLIEKEDKIKVYGDILKSFNSNQNVLR